MYKKHLSFLLALLMLAGTMASCGSEGSASKGNDADSDASSVTTAAPYSDYTFKKDWAGETFNVLSYEGNNITTDGEDGEVYNDAKYKCITTLEDKMGITVNETEMSRDAYKSTVINSIAAGEYVYDMMYVYMSDIYLFSDGGYLNNLLELDNLSLDKDWWLHEYNDLCKVNNTLYSAEGYGNMSIVNSTNILLYNEDLADTVKLDTPYKLVKDGDWTLDKFAEYLKVGANLNKGSDVPDSGNVWNLDQPGNGAMCQALLLSFNERFLESKDGKIVITFGSEHFYNACDKIAGLMTEIAPYSFSKEKYGICTVFNTNQALFAYGEIGNTDPLREVDFSFGVLPYPKYDESQDRYYCRKSWPSCSVTIPITVKDPERSAAFADALNYLSYEIIWPVYRGLVLEQKNLRNEESIEMLDIILKSGVPSLFSFYSVGSNLVESVSSDLMNGGDGVSSLIASNKTAIEAQLEAINSSDK